MSSGSHAKTQTPIPGATATVSNNLTLMFDIGYDVTNAFSMQMMGGIPPRPTVTVTARVTLDPSIVGVGVKFRFR